MERSSRQTQIDQVHETVNNIFMDIQQIRVTSPDSRDAKQAAILDTIVLRKTLDNMGLKHSVSGR